MPEFQFASDRVQHKNQGLSTTPEAPSRCHLCYRPIAAKHDLNAITANQPGSYFMNEAHLAADVAERAAQGEQTHATVTPLGPECAKRMPKGSVFKAEVAEAILAKYGIQDGA